jgi:hypothetical protein
MTRIQPMCVKPTNAPTSLRHGAHMAWQSALRKTHMPAMCWLPQCTRRDLPGGAGSSRVQRGRCGHSAPAQELRIRANAAWQKPGPVIVRVRKTVQGRGEHIVELIKVTRLRAGHPASNRPGCCASLLQGLGFHGAQEHDGCRPAG